MPRNKPGSENKGNKEVQGKKSPQEEKQSGASPATGGGQIFIAGSAKGPHIKATSSSAVEAASAGNFAPESHGKSDGEVSGRIDVAESMFNNDHVAAEKSGGGAESAAAENCSAAAADLSYPPSPYEVNWWEAVIPARLRHHKIPEALNYLLLSLIRNSLCMYFKINAAKKYSVELFSSTHTEKDFANTIPIETLQRVSEIIAQEIEKDDGSHPKSIWFSIVSEIFRILQEGRSPDFIARLRSAFHEAFDAFGAEGNAFAVNTVDLQSCDLKTILSGPLKSLKLNMLFYLLSLYTSYDITDVAKRISFINAVKHTLNDPTEADQEYQTALGRVEILKTLRAEHPDQAASTATQYVRVLAAAVCGYNSSGNFGVIIKQWSENKFKQMSDAAPAFASASR
jgi:hypothetical protein